MEKIFNFFSKQVLSMFQDSAIILSEKNFFRLSDQSESRYRDEIRKAETPFTCNQRRRTLPVRITWKGDCLIALRCESARPQSRSKIFKVKKIFNFFSKQVLSMFQDSAIILSEKNFFRISDQSESRYRDEIRKAETPPYL